MVFVIRVRSNLGVWRISLDGNDVSLNLSDIKCSILKQYNIPITIQSFSPELSADYIYKPDTASLKTLGKLKLYINYNYNIKISKN